MFNNTRTMLGICGLLLLAVTICGIFFFTEASQRSLRFWIITGGIIFSEISFTLACVDIGGNHKDKGYFYRILNPFFATAYMIFSLLMLPISSLEISDKGLLFIEISALTLFVIATILNNMAVATASTNDQKYYRASQNKRNWLSMLSSYQLYVKDLNNDQIHKKFTNLLDDIRYASVIFDADTELIDKKITTEVDSLITALGSKDLSIINEKITDIEYSLQKRTAIGKSK